jgi:FXSXX-COOH protein
VLEREYHPGTVIMDAPVEGDEFALVDLSGVALADLDTLEPNALHHSLRRILEEIDRPQDAVAGWNSAV